MVIFRACKCTHSHAHAHMHTRAHTRIHEHARAQPSSDDGPISTQLYSHAFARPLQQLVIGGLDRVYELGRVFRNEGIKELPWDPGLMCSWVCVHVMYLCVCVWGGGKCCLPFILPALLTLGNLIGIFSCYKHCIRPPFKIVVALLDSQLRSPRLCLSYKHVLFPRRIRTPRLVILHPFPYTPYMRHYFTCKSLHDAYDNIF